MVSPRRALAAWTIAAAGWLPAQTEFAGGGALEAAKTWDLPRAWRVSVGPALEWRPIYGDGAAEESAPPALRNLDLNVAVQRRWFERWRLGTSLRLRARYAFGDEAATELRPWLYATRTGDLRYVRTSQRLRTELRLRGDRGEALEPSWRHRYRFALERALRGVVADEGEWTVVASAEVLLSTASAVADPTSVGVRPVFGVARGRYELGVEYRYEREVAGGEREHVWLALVEVGL